MISHLQKRNTLADFEFKKLNMNYIQYVGFSFKVGRSCPGFDDMEVDSIQSVPSHTNRPLSI